MNTPVTSREAILATCRNLVSENGITSINMRSVAQVCQVALGSIYYYFPSKNNLLIATIESVWQDIFQLDDELPGQLTFLEYVEHCFQQIQVGMTKYPNFFTIHTISFSNKEDQLKARRSMEAYFQKIRTSLITTLEADASIDSSVFSEEFSRQDLVDFVLSNMMTIFLLRQGNTKLLLEAIRRIIDSY
jgi:AcrR family transcriptional regulator